MPLSDLADIGPSLSRNIRRIGLAFAPEEQRTPGIARLEAEAKGERLKQFITEILPYTDKGQQLDMKTMMTAAKKYGVTGPEIMQIIAEFQKMNQTQAVMQKAIADQEMAGRKEGREIEKHAVDINVKLAQESRAEDKRREEKISGIKKQFDEPAQTIYENILKQTPDEQGRVYLDSITTEALLLSPKYKNIVKDSTKKRPYVEVGEPKVDNIVWVDDPNSPGVQIPVTRQEALSGRMRKTPTPMVSVQMGATERKEYLGLEDLMSRVKRIGELYKPDYVGVVESQLGAIGEYTGTTSPEESEFRAALNDVADYILRLRSGAQINEQEFKRMWKFLPDLMLHPKSWKSRYDRLLSDVENTLQRRKGYYNTEKRNPLQPEQSQSAPSEMPESTIEPSPQGRTWQPGDLRKIGGKIYELGENGQWLAIK